MSLKEDISKLTASSPAVRDLEAKFMPLNGLSRAQIDLAQNNQPLRLRNDQSRSLYEKLDGLEYVNGKSAVEPLEYDECYLDEIRSSVRAVNGGEISNDRIEKFMRSRQGQEEKKQIGKSQSSQLRSEKTNFQNHKLSKNGVIRGLLNKEIISLEDLHISDNEQVVEETGKNFSSKVYLEQDPDDPDLMVLSMKDYGDFVLDRIGTKKIMTPRHHLMNLDDSAFNFVKK